MTVYSDDSVYLTVLISLFTTELQPYISKMTLKPIKLGQTKLVLVYDHQSSSVGLCMQDYKSLRKAKGKGERGFV